jgi:hypothetical protein
MDSFSTPVFHPVAGVLIVRVVSADAAKSTSRMSFAAILAGNVTAWLVPLDVLPLETVAMTGFPGGGPVALGVNDAVNEGVKLGDWVREGVREGVREAPIRSPRC